MNVTCVGECVNSHINWREVAIHVPCEEWALLGMHLVQVVVQEGYIMSIWPIPCSVKVMITHPELVGKSDEELNDLGISFINKAKELGGSINIL